MDNYTYRVPTDIFFINHISYYYVHIMMYLYNHTSLLGYLNILNMVFISKRVSQALGFHELGRKRFYRDLLSEFLGVVWLLLITTRLVPVYSSL